MRKNAFTLIELLIAVSLIGLLFTIGIAYYQNFSRQQIIIQTAKEFKNNLRHAQSKALAGEKDCRDSACGGTEGECTLTSKTLEGWFVEIAADSYEIYGRCEGTKFSSKTVLLPPTLTLGASVASFHFQPLSRGVSEDLIDFTISGYDKTYSITLTKAGEIKDEGFPAAPTPTPSPTPAGPTPTPSPSPVSTPTPTPTPYVPSPTSTPTPPFAPTSTPTPACARRFQPCEIPEDCCSTGTKCTCHPSGVCIGQDCLP